MKRVKNWKLKLHAFYTSSTMQISDMLGASATSSYKQRFCYTFHMKLYGQTSRYPGRGVFKLRPTAAFPHIPGYIVQMLPLTRLITLMYFLF